VYICNDDGAVSEENKEMKGQYSFHLVMKLYSTLDLRQRAF